ncbi:unnamed protein product [Brassicogethes aeneus]|uniref:NADH dehydrogenase [ubiquinone] 1 alpha subcomplex subunit 11 n=1 Tax=Brassicogethes aeneus TaxID=1431903 RepID=A0A9P0AWX0_BRAAE|nr:unnamed protein product [Brassicogethes aeneus]
MSKELKPFKFFDSPDGEDIFKKLSLALKPTILAAIGLSTADVLLYSHPKGYAKTLARYAFIGLPIIGITSTFVIVTNLAGSLRKQDGKINWFIGGAAAGSLFGVWSRRPMVGFNMAMFMGIMGSMRKSAQQHGWDVIPPSDTPIAAGTVWSVHQDWTLTAERPRGWTTSKQ